MGRFKCLALVLLVPTNFQAPRPIPGTFLDGLLGVVFLVVAQPP